MLQRHEAPPALQAERDGSAIEARGLVMRYGDREVLHGINLTVPQGMVVGFLGPNGAGDNHRGDPGGLSPPQRGPRYVLGMDPAPAVASCGSDRHRAAGDRPQPD